MWFPCDFSCPWGDDEAEQIAAQKEAERLDRKRWMDTVDGRNPKQPPGMVIKTR